MTWADRSLAIALLAFAAAASLALTTARGDTTGQPPDPGTVRPPPPLTPACVDSVPDAGVPREPADTGNPVIRATSDPEGGSRIVLRHPALDGRPDRILLATRVHGIAKEGTGQGYGAALAARYDRETRLWSLEGAGPQLPAGATWLVEVLPPGPSAYVHRASPTRTQRDRTYLRHPLLDRRPDNPPLILPFAQNGGFAPHPVAVTYDPRSCAWAVIHRDGAVVPDGSTFFVVVGATGTHRGPPVSDWGNTSQLSDPSLDGNDRAAVLLTPILAGAPSADAPEFGMIYDPAASRWLVVAEMLDAFPTGASFAYRVATNDRTAAERLGTIDWGFESEDRIGWTAEGAAFAGPPSRAGWYPARYFAPVALGGDYWDTPFPLGNRGAYAGAPPDGPPAVGTLTSDEFVVTRPWLSFLLAGRQDPSRIHVDLDVAQEDDPNGALQRVTLWTGTQRQTMRRQVLDVSPYLGWRARIRIVDADSDPRGFLLVDDFRWSDDDPRPGLIRASGADAWLDPDVPVWGWADTHAHPMSHLSMSGRLIGGQPTGAASEALSPATVAQMRAGVFNGVGGPSLNFIQSFVLGANAPGWSGFEVWPRFDSEFDQQMHVDWIRRAYDGGLRLMVALAINHPILAQLAGGPLDSRDSAAIRRQVDATAALATVTPFMEVARTAADARRIVRQNKLAIVLGVEVEGSGDCYIQPAQSCSPDQARAVVAELHDLGVRYVHPLHVSNNSFGGAALYDDKFVVGDFLLNGEPFRWSGDPSLGYRIGRFTEDLLYSQFGGPGRIGVAGGYVNQRGMTAAGEAFLGALMSRGMLIDIDHMSQLTTARALALAEGWRGRGYPLFAGHMDFRALSLTLFETNEVGKFAHESQKADETVARLARLGGMLGAIPHLQDIKEGPSSVPNDCAGSSKSWAQTYSRLLRTTGGRGAIGSDFNGLLKHPGPRFGTYACHALKGDGRREGIRLGQAAAQDRGVRYDRPIRSLFDRRFADDGLGTAEQRDTWFAGALVLSNNVPPTPLTGTGPYDRRRNLAVGLSIVNPGDGRLACREYPDAGACPAERRAGFLVRGGSDASGARQEVRDIVAYLRPIWRQWLAMTSNAPNPPLARLVTGARDFDINLDGLAHYGMLPDFFQDIANADRQLMLPLFRSAEDFIQAWERTERAARM